MLSVTVNKHFSCCCSPSGFMCNISVSDCCKHPHQNAGHTWRQQYVHWGLIGLYLNGWGLVVGWPAQLPSSSLWDSPQCGCRSHTPCPALVWTLAWQRGCNIGLDPADLITMGSRHWRLKLHTRWGLGLAAVSWEPFSCDTTYLCCSHLLQNPCITITDLTQATKHCR